MRIWKFASGAGTIVVTALALAMTPSASAKKPIIVKKEQLPQNTRLVSYADLNLASAAGERTLMRRVGGAVRYVCRHADPMNIGSTADRTCRSFAWRGARPQIARAVKRAHDLAKTGTSTIPAVALAVAAPQ